MDPRTSTPGLGFVAWTLSALGSQYKDFWQKLKPNILTMTSGWSEGWGMFTKGEAPLVISYTTSPAYNAEYEDDYRFKTLLFEQGHICQVEGAAILKNAPNKDGAKAFLDFLITEDTQNLIPLTQWMYPVNKNVELPQSYKKAAPIPQKMLSIDSEKVDSSVEEIISLLDK